MILVALGANLPSDAGPPAATLTAALARLEARIAVETLLDRLSAMEPVPDVSYPPLPGSLGHQPVPARLIARN